MTEPTADSRLAYLGWLTGSVLFWSFVAISSLLLFPVALVIWTLTAAFDPGKRLLHQFTCFWASLYSWLNPLWRVHVDRRELLRDDRPTVFVANHLSLVDILVLFRTFADFKWVSKIEVFKIPVIGWNMRLNDYIPIRRGDRTSVLRMLQLCEATLDRGSPVMMFPEGTRSPDGHMRAFKPGAFDLALRTGCPIQPILIQGSARALPKHGLVIRGRHRIRITVMPPLEAGTFGERDADALAQHVHGLMAAELERLGGPSGVPTA